MPLLPKDRTSHQIFNTSHEQKHSRLLERSWVLRVFPYRLLRQKPVITCLNVCYTRQTRTMLSSGCTVLHDTLHQAAQRGELFSRPWRLLQLLHSKKAKLEKRSLILHSVCDKGALEKHNPAVKHDWNTSGCKQHVNCRCLNFYAFISVETCIDTSKYTQKTTVSA